jgi:DNA-binding transcriptional ArsR family regulator
MKESKVIRDPRAFQLLADETRLRMIYLMRAKELTVSQMAADLGLTPQTIYHHIKKLKECDMVEVSKEVRVDHLVESYYRATAGIFHFVSGGGNDKCRGKDPVGKAFKALGKMGHDLDIGPVALNSISKSVDVLRTRRENPDIITKVYDMDDLDPFNQNDVIEFTMLLTMSDGEFEKYIDAQRKIREALRSSRKGKR